MRKKLDQGSSNPRIQCGECGRWMRLHGRDKNGQAVQRFYGSCDVSGGDHPCGREVCTDCCPKKCLLAVPNITPARSVAELQRQLDRANRIIGWMMPYIGNMCPPEDGLFQLNIHCFENHVPDPNEETKGRPINQRPLRAKSGGAS